LFTLSNETKRIRNTMLIYIGVVVFCIAFGIIYETYSHGVISYFTILGFLFPLILGLIPYILLFVFLRNYGPSIFSSYTYNAGVATITVGSYFKGMLEIYGTTREIYVIIYFVVAIVLLAVGLISYIVSIVIERQKVGRI